MKILAPQQSALGAQVYIHTENGAGIGAGLTDQTQQHENTLYSFII